MLTYAYADLNVAGLGRFYWRSLSVGVPYLRGHLLSVPAASGTLPQRRVRLKGLAQMAETGYYQLYFLLMIMQFYLVFPLVLVLLRRTRGHHGLPRRRRGPGPGGDGGTHPLAAAAPLMQKYSQEDVLAPALPDRRLRYRLPPGAGGRLGTPARAARSSC